MHEASARRSRALDKCIRARRKTQDAHAGKVPLVAHHHLVFKDENMRPYAFPIEIKTQPGRIITTLVILAVLLVALYIYLGRMTFVLWVLSVGVVIAFVLALKQTFDRGPCIVINEEGINDKRLRMGTIRWSDIERVRMHGVGGAYFISLELLNREHYLSRQPAYIRISNQIWRLYNVSLINIKVAYMDVAPDDLFELIMSEVELNRARS